jgi:DNA-binding transcriptional ArsR family regulator
MMINQNVVVKAKFFSGFSDPTRLSIVETLAEGPKNVGEIANITGQSQPNVSNHLACLRECGLVTRERNGRITLYSLSGEDIARLLSIADTIVAQRFSNLASCTRY